MLYKVGPGEEEKYPLTLNGKKTIGRKKICDLSFENDNALSGIHCYLYSKDKKIYVQDNNSTNGTFVNGVPITGVCCGERRHPARGFRRVQDCAGVRDEYAYQ